MDKKQLASRLIFVGGVAELIVAVLHFLMPLQISQTEEISNLPNNYRDYIFHATLAVGLCMAIFGVLSIYFSRRVYQGERAAWIFGLSQGILWTTRVLSELLLPIRVPLLFMPNPTMVILPMVAAIALLFLIPTLAFRAEMQAKA